MLLDEFRELLNILRARQVEGQDTECKAAQSGFPKDLVESISAFSNTIGGGIVVLGVGDRPEFAVVGVGDVERVQSTLDQVCAQELSPPVRPMVSTLVVEGKTVIVVEIPEAGNTEKPVHIRSRGIYHGSFIRAASGDRQLTEYEVLKILENRGQPRHDMEPVEETSMDDLDNQSIEAYVSRVRGRSVGPIADADPMTILRAAHVVVEREGRFLPTLAGLLMFGKYPQSLYPNLRAVFLVYPHVNPDEPGPDRERYVANETVEGSLPVVLNRLMLLLNRHLDKRTVITGAPEREERLEYPREALREALANALLHRDYSAQARGSQIQVALYPDRLEISNPGGLYGTVTLENMDQPDVQQARNTALMRIAEDSALVENRGGGIGAIIAAMRKYNLSIPLFYSSLSRFSVTFRNHHLLNEEALQWLRQLPAEAQNDNQKLALVFARVEGRITNSDYRRMCGVDTTSATRELSELVRLGLLSMTGTRRWATYELVRFHAKQREKGSSPFERLPEGSNEVYEYIHAHQPVARREIVSSLRGTLSAPQVDYRLARLVDEDLIAPTNSTERASNRRYVITSANSRITR